ncbi:AtpZ/AtpI family protein [Frigoriglobus tundricola]|uniref:AtpZ/AtpI family protein n=1 Tax=Frigoriglobus tundricola TaxID=2774151 RepID=UPI00148E9898
MSAERADYRVLSLAGTAVAELVVPVLLGAWIDRRYGSAPWGLLVGAVVGFVGGVAHLMVVASRSSSSNGGGGGESGRGGPSA